MSNQTVKSTLSMEELSQILPPADAAGQKVVSYGNPVSASYNPLSETVRRATSGDIQCSLFCGGERCKYESGSRWSPKDTAVKGLFSHWITENVLAMARPNSRQIQQYKIVEQFKDLGIKSVFNLQQPFEHNSCGPPLHSAGFSYNPQDFMDNGIFFYNFIWKDYGTLSKTTLLDIVKVMAFALSEGKAAVHCHAGLGRTGVFIACYLVYALRCRPNDAIRYVRLKRPHSIQTSGQIVCVQEFAQYVLPLFVIFPHIYERKQVSRNDKYRPETAEEFTLSVALNKQRQVLHGLEARHLKYIPKIIYLLCERMVRLAHPRLNVITIEEHSQTVTTPPQTASSTTTSSNIATKFFHSPAPKQELNFETNDLVAFCNYFLASEKAQDLWRPPSMLSLDLLLSSTDDKNSNSTRHMSADETSSQTSSDTKQREQTPNIYDILRFNGSASNGHSKSLDVLSEPENDEDIDALEEIVNSTILADAGNSKLPGNKGIDESSNPADAMLDKVLIGGMDGLLAHAEGFNTETGLYEDTTDSSDNDDSQDSSDEDSEIEACDGEKNVDTMHNFTLKAPEKLDDSEENAETLTKNAIYKELAAQKELLRKAAEEDMDEVSLTSRIIARCLLLDHEELGRAFVLRQRQYMRDLNIHQNSWNQLRLERDPRILSALLWAWMDGLKEPMLNKQDLTKVVLKSDDPVSVLPKLDRGTRFTTEYLVRFVSRLELGDSALRESILRRLTCSLCHQKLVIEGNLKPQNAPATWIKMREGTARRALDFMRKLHDLVSSASPAIAATMPTSQKKDSAAQKLKKTFRGVNLMAQAIAR